MLRRGRGIALALLVEALVVLLLLTLAPVFDRKDPPKGRLATFSIGAESSDADSSEAKPKPRTETRRADRDVKPQPVKPQPKPEQQPDPKPEVLAPNSVTWLSRREYSNADLSRAPSSAPAAAAPAPAAGQGTRGNDKPDSAIVGRAPNGEILYAAEWVRRPRDSELQPYLPDRGRPDGWGLVACRTTANHHVEDCQELDDWPRGSGYAGAVRQAAWQFLVRAPRVNGVEQVGAWVSIRITYTTRR